MPAWMWIVAAAAVAFAALVTFGRGWWRVRWVLDWLQVFSVRRWWYSWQRAAHVVEQAQAGPALAPDFYGSMSLDEERDWQADQLETGLRARGYTIEEFYSAPPEVAHEPDWREQTAADLAPEALALDGGGGVLGSAHEPVQLTLPPRPDPGPGDLPSLDPGPDQFREFQSQAELVVHLEAHGWFDPAVQERLADTGDVMDAHLLADVQAFMRAQDDDARAYGSARALGWAGFMRDLEAALA